MLSDDPLSCNTKYTSSLHLSNLVLPYVISWDVISPGPLSYFKSVLALRVPSYRFEMSTLYATASSDGQAVLIFSLIPASGIGAPAMICP